jgi:hypothetical protein
MRFPPHKKVPQAPGRAEQLRQRRADSGTLHALSPETVRVHVNLRFLPVAASPHAAQSFVLYPAARAFFEYACPYGDCAGIYDLSEQAKRALDQDKKQVTGTVECTGTRSGPGAQKQVCGLRMSYSISAERLP